MSLVFACIAPHGDVDLAPEVRAAMEELGERFDEAAPEVAVVVTPHSVHVEGHFAVVTAGKVSAPASTSPKTIRKFAPQAGEWETDRDLASALLEAPLPILGVSYGGTDAAAAQFPLDWGAEIPLSFMRARRVVVVSSAQDRPLDEHLRLGEAIAALPGRVALIASADNGHAHDANGTYGYDPAAAEYDAQLQDILAGDRFDFLPLAERVEAAKADSLWQLLVLQGAVGQAARADVLAYAAPTFYGMLVAEVAVG